MKEDSRDLFQYERKVLNKANDIIEDEKYKDSALFKEYKSLTFKYKRLLRQTEKILKISDNNQKLLRKTQNNLENLLNNAGQGFLTFGEELLIDSEYSLECKRIFGEDIAEKNCMDVIFKHSELDIEKEVLEEIFKEENSKVEIYLSLLPKEIKLNDKLLKIKYKFIEEERKLMCIITDVTEKRDLENKLEEERHNLKMTITVIVNQGLVKKYITDYKDYFTYEIYELMGEYDSYNLLEEMYREIHTFKAVFSQWEMNNTAKALHKLENEIVDFKKETTKITKDDVLKFIAGIDFDGCLEKDIEIIESKLEKDFLTQENTIMVNEDDILKLEQKIKKYFPESERQDVMEKIKKLRCKTFKEMISGYEDYVVELADRVGKKINTFEINSKGVLVKEEVYHDFNKSLLHIFRNIVYHGLEEPSERLKKGKSEGGNIVCHIDKNKDGIVINISDDGKGINIDKLKERAVEQGIYNKYNIDFIPQDEIIKLIFSDDFSTEETAGKIAGRGVGMAAVKKEVLKLGGEISVETVKDEGTTFKITFFNLESEFKEDIVNFNSFKNKLKSGFTSFLENELELNVVEEYAKDNQSTKIPLLDFDVIINVRFKELYDIILSADYNSAEALMKSFVEGRVAEEQKEAFIKSSLSEILNIVVGGLETIEEGNGHFEMAPATIAVEGNLLKYKNNRITMEKFCLEEGKIFLSLVKRCES